MEFHSYPTPPLKPSTKCENRDEMRVAALSTDRPEYREWIAQHAAWIEDKKPYYCMWPAIIPPLLRLRLEIPANSFDLPIPRLCIRFPVDREIEVASRRILSILVCKVSADVSRIIPDGGEGFIVYIYTSGNAIPAVVFERREQSVEELFNMARNLSGLSKLAPEVKGVALVGLRMVIGLCLLADDPEFVVPDVLAKDRAEFERDGDPAIIKRALRRGKRGWMVGQQIGELAPYIRPPHFAIRWVGQGPSKVPKLRPVKGHIVRRKKVTTMPSGYEV